MRWKISIEGSDEITCGHRFEFEIEKSLDDLATGSLGLSIEEGKAIMASLQRHIVEQQCALRFCSDVTARDVAERDRSRTIRPERSRRFTALSPWRARGCTPAAAACPVLISQSLRFQSSALTEQRLS